MRSYSRSDLSDQVLIQRLEAHAADERASTAELLADIAEVDARQLYLRAGYPSMYTYCVDHLHMSEDEAFRRIRVARTGQGFPAVLPAVADGRLHLSAVVLLAPCLTPENAEGLIAAAAHKSKAQIEHLLAQRFPRPDLPTVIEALAAPASAISDNQLVPEPVGCHNVTPRTAETTCLAAPRPKLAPLAPERFALRVTIARSTHDKLRHAQALLGHQIPPGEIAAVLDRALDALILQLERRKFAATDKPRPGRGSRRKRYIPAAVRRAVWERDGGRCAFVSESGRRCPETRDLQFDHRDPVARGGEATVNGMRLLCRAHNQFEAEWTLGAQFMADKRHGAQRAAAEKKAAAS
jgi:5-methylcytosine-specific restriction endonuclease McrA